MNDGINDGDETERLTALWDLTAEPTKAPDDAVGRAAARLAEAPDGGPLDVRDDTRVWCRVPEGVVALRAKDPDTALRWRHAVRDVFTTAYADGLRATAMSSGGWYTLTLPQAPGFARAGETPSTAPEDAA